MHAGPLYTDTGFWDTYRTQFPLLNLLDRPRSAEMMEGFLNFYREGGWLSQWSSPGPRGVMIGTHSEAVLAHAIASGVTGFDRETAYAAMRRDCMDVPDRRGVGRVRSVRVGRTLCRGWPMAVHLGGAARSAGTDRAHGRAGDNCGETGRASCNSAVFSSRDLCGENP